MKTNSKLTLALATFISFSSYAASLQDQISAVAAAEQAGKAEIQRQQDEQKAQEKKKQRAEEQRRARLAASKAAEKARLDEEKRADKKRDQSYEDELRQLEIQRLKLSLERETTRVKRENEFIDQDLKQQAAQTDVIQSRADANRNITEGTKSLLESEGKAKEKKADKLPGN